jgi:hypothetical protein
MAGMQDIKATIGENHFLSALTEYFTKFGYIFTCN